MNILKLLIPFLLFGCAPTTEELIAKAHRTADWSQVEKRLAAESRHEARHKSRCAGGYIEVCEGNSKEIMSCVCVKRGNLRWEDI